MAQFNKELLHIRVNKIQWNLQLPNCRAAVHTLNGQSDLPAVFRKLHWFLSILQSLYMPDVGPLRMASFEHAASVNWTDNVKKTICWHFRFKVSRQRMSFEKNSVKRVLVKLKCSKLCVTGIKIIDLMYVFKNCNNNRSPLFISVAFISIRIVCVSV